jgi:hypothetical protein
MDGFPSVNWIKGGGGGKRKREKPMAVARNGRVIEIR